MPLHISRKLSIPDDAVTQTFGIVAQRGAGKTYLTCVVAEEMIGGGFATVILDPMGVYWGLRSSADGKSEGLPIVILGGDHGDLPLEAGSGKAVAEWVAEQHQSVVLDISTFRKNEQRQFVTDFAETLYRKNREPVHLILDEADLWAPQRPMKGHERMLGAVEDLVRRGRVRGIGLSLVTQRPAVLHKDVLTQVSALVILRIVGPQDRSAVESWIKYHGAHDKRNEVLSSLGSLPIGTAWIWSPGWLDRKLQRVQIRKRRTFDSSSTPEVGTKIIAPQARADVDLEALRQRIGGTIEKVKAEDPRELKKRIAELEKQVHQLTEKLKVTKAAYSSVEVSDDSTFKQALESIRVLAVDALTNDGAKALGAKALEDRSHGVSRRPSPQPVSALPGLGKGEVAVLTAIAQSPDGATREQIAVMTGYKRSTRDTYIRSLQQAGFVGSGGVEIVATKAGRAKLGSKFEPLPTGGSGHRTFDLCPRRD